MIHRNDIPFVATLLLVLLLAVGLVTLGAVLSVSVTVPMCQEDAVLVGVGSFDRGRWSRYECGPALDDYLK